MPRIVKFVRPDWYSGFSRAIAALHCRRSAPALRPAPFYTALGFVWHRRQQHAMITELASTEDDATTSDSVTRAVEVLRGGGVVALPTETVYGLAANAFDAQAVAEVFAAKERPSFDPLIVHLQDARSLSDVAQVPEEVADLVEALTRHFWPGPLTLLLPKTDRVPDIVTAGLPTVAVRVSENPIFKSVIKELGSPLAAPSANRFGRISPTSASSVMEELGGRIPLIVDGGACSCGLESTIVRVVPPKDPGSTTSHGRNAKPVLEVLRAGPVTLEDLKKFGRVKLVKNRDVAGNAPEAPGMLASHYAPRTPLRLVANASEFVPDPDKRYALLAYRGRDRDGFLDLVEWLEIAVLSPGSGKLPEAAVRLFFLMRQLDECGADEIIAEAVPEHGLGAAIMDRLRRASGGA